MMVWKTWEMALGGCLFITLDCAQGYHQLQVYFQDQDKLALFGVDGKKYTFTVMPFGSVNASLFHIAIICCMQAQWTDLFHLFMNNNAEIVTAKKNLPPLVTPHLLQSNKPSDFYDGRCLPDVTPNGQFVLRLGSGLKTPPPSTTYTASCLALAEATVKIPCAVG